MRRGVGGDERDAVGVGVEARAGVGKTVEHDEVEVLAREFGAGVFEPVVGFESEAHEPLCALLAATEIGGDVGIGAEAEGEFAGGFALDFVLGGFGGGVVGHGGTEDGAAAPGKFAQGDFVHLAGTLHIDAANVGRVGGEADGAGDEHHVVAGTGGTFGQREAHFAARVVADVAHGVDAFARGAGGDEQPRAERLGSRSGGAHLGGAGAGGGGGGRCSCRCGRTLGGVFAARCGRGGRGGEEAGEVLDDDFGFLHAPFAHEGGGQKTVGGFDDVHPAAAQEVEVVLRGGVGIHVEVHGRGDEGGGLHREVGGEEHVVGDAVGHLAECGGRGGGHDEDVGPAPEIDVAVPTAVAPVEKFAHHRVLRKGGEGEGRDELFAGGGDDHLHFGALAHEEADEGAGFVGGDAAGDAEHDVAAGEGRGGGGGHGRVGRKGRPRGRVFLIIYRGDGSGGVGRGRSGHSRGRKAGRFPSAAGDFGRRLAGFRSAARGGTAVGGSLRGGTGACACGVRKSPTSALELESPGGRRGVEVGVCALRAGACGRREGVHREGARCGAQEGA